MKIIRSLFVLPSTKAFALRGDYVPRLSVCPPPLHHRTLGRPALTLALSLSLFLSSYFNFNFNLSTSTSTSTSTFITFITFSTFIDLFSLTLTLTLTLTLLPRFLASSLTYSLTHLLTYLLTYSLTHSLTHSLTYFFSCLSFGRGMRGPRAGSRQKQHSTAARITVIIYTTMTKQNKL